MGPNKRENDLTVEQIDKLIEMVKNKEIPDEKLEEVLVPLEIGVRDRAFKDYQKYSEEYIKITDKKGNKVPFKHNRIQVEINKTIKKLRAAGKLVRVIVLKARQHGVSTNEQGRMLYNTSTKENRTGLIIAHELPATTKIFNKAKYMYENLPAHVKPLKRASNAKELLFDTPTDYKGKEKGLNSRINIQVAGDVKIGRGDTIHFVHISEFAYWETPEGKSAKKQLSGILQAVPKTPESEVVIESTANGYNEFKELWDDAVAGKNEWTPLFFPWHDNPEYVMECTEEEHERLINSLDKKIYEYLFGKEDNTGNHPGVVTLFNLSKEQVKWWVWTFRNDCNGDLNMMKQENPAYPEEAFMATGTPVFDTEKINIRINQLKKIYKKNPPEKGRFAFEWRSPEAKDEIKDRSIIWVPDSNGFVTIYEKPEHNCPYVIGGDTKGEGRDFYAGVVINNATGKRVAVVHNPWTNSKPYTWQMYCLGMYYNIALIGIEMNYNTGPIEELARLNYPRQYTRKIYDDFTGAYKHSYGWKTDGNTRPLIIDKEVDLIENNIDLFTDITMLNECLTFVYDKNGRPDARSGKHDDILIADMIANEIRSQQSFEIELDKEREHQSFDEDTENDFSSSDYEASPFN
jgi:hypothetical protein